MSSQKRQRACDPCYRLKVHCELSSADSQPPCQRCVRLSKDCVPSAPKRQKDRVAELEAKVDALTKLLQAQGITDRPPGEAQSVEPVIKDRSGTSYGKPSIQSSASGTGASFKRRRLSNEEPDAVDYGSGRQIETQSDDPSSPASRLDKLIPQEKQRQILNLFVTEMLAQFPVISTSGDFSLEALQTSRPTLLRAILFAAGPGYLSTDERESNAKAVMNDIANKAIGSGEKSMALIQAIQICVVWYSRNHHQHVASYQLTQLACSISADIGLGGAQGSPLLLLFSHDEDVKTPDAWRAWLVCGMLSSSLAVLIRRPNILPWSPSHEDCLNLLQSSPQASANDKLLCQYALVERLCERIVTELAFCDLDTVYDVTELCASIPRLQEGISNWSAQIPTACRTSGMMFLQHIMTMYAHEAVLHTKTNKFTFAAPFMAERLSATDFPAPDVTPEHVVSLYSLRDATHAALDVVCSLSITQMMALPSHLYAARALYAIYILAKLYIAVAVPGNSYGAFMNTDDLKFDTYLRKLVDIAAQVKRFDNTTGPARIMSAMKGFTIWFDEINISIGYPSRYNQALQGTEAFDSLLLPSDRDRSTYKLDSTLPGVDDFEDLWLGDLFGDVNWLEHFPATDAVGSGPST